MIEFRLLGGLRLADGEGTSIGSVLAQPKRLALLTYLALAEPRGFHRRDLLLALFWPESSDAQARAALSQAVYYLRRSLGESVLVSRGNDELGVAFEELRTDVTAFESAVEAGRVRDALDLYDGELMAAFHLRDVPEWERWLDVERARLRALATATAWSVAEEALEAGASEDAIRFARQATLLTPHDEAGIRRLIRMMERVGGRAAAIRAYEDAATRLEHELGIEPSAETQELISTIRIRGGVTSGPPTRERAIGASAGGHAAAARSRRIGPLWAMIGAAAALLVVRVALHPDQGAPGDQGIESSPVPVSLQRVAVLSFVDLTSDASGDHLAAGTADELRRRLASLGDLRVLAGSSIARYRGTDLGAREIGTELDVGTLIEGTVRETGDRIRVTAHLVDVATEVTIWSQEFEGGSGAILDLQTEIAEGVARALGVSVRSDARRRLATSGTRSPEAFHLYLAGRARLGTADPDAVREARSYFEEAIAADSGFARAWAGLADVYDELAGMNIIPSAEAYPRSRAFAEGSLARDPALAEAHGSLAHALSVYFWDSELATHHFRRAIELDPSDPRARRAYATHLRNLGLYDQARAEAATALELAPRDFFAGFELGVIPYFQRRYGEAVDRFRRLIAQGPEYAYANSLLALALSRQDRHDDAVEALDALGQLGSLADAVSIRGYVLARAGRTTEARDVLSAMDERAEGADGLAFDQAVVHLGLGEYDVALDLLERAADTRDWHLSLIGGEPIFDPLRSDPQFEALLRRAGLAR
jgi:DNA-binding SARP family transcriptional activator/TolB-like protein